MVASNLIQIKIDQSALRRLTDTKDGDVSKAMLIVGIKVANEAKIRCPVDTGRLRSSISVEQKREGRYWATYVGSNVEYAYWVHEGSRGRPGRPFLQDAYNAVIK